MFNNMSQRQNQQVSGGSAVNRATMNGGRSSVQGSISNNGGSGGTVSGYTQIACHQDMVSLSSFQEMEREELQYKRELENLKWQHWKEALMNGII